MDDLDRVSMVIPARREYAKLLRLAAAGIANRMNFDYDGLEDIKMGLEEAYLLAINNPAQEDFDLTFEIRSDRLEILVKGLGRMDSLEEELSQKFGFSILNSVMDQVEWLTIDGVKHLRMVKNI